MLFCLFVTRHLPGGSSLGLLVPPMRLIPSGIGPGDTEQCGSPHCMLFLISNKISNFLDSVSFVVGKSGEKNKV